MCCWGGQVKHLGLGAATGQPGALGSSLPGTDPPSRQLSGGGHIREWLQLAVATGRRCTSRHVGRLSCASGLRCHLAAASVPILLPIHGFLFQYTYATVNAFSLPYAFLSNIFFSVVNFSCKNAVYGSHNIQNACQLTVYAVGKAFAQQRLKYLSFGGKSKVICRVLTVEGSVPQPPCCSRVNCCL